MVGRRARGRRADSRRPADSAIQAHPLFLPPSSGHATISHEEREADIRVYTDFSCWQPGPGEIDVSLYARTHLAPNGFASASATCADGLIDVVTWVR